MVDMIPAHTTLPSPYCSVGRELNMFGVCEQIQKHALRSVNGTHVSLRRTAREFGFHRDCCDGMLTQRMEVVCRKSTEFRLQHTLKYTSAPVEIHIMLSHELQRQALSESLRVSKTVPSPSCEDHKFIKTNMVG